MKDAMCPIGAIQSYYASHSTGPIAPWITSEETAIHEKIFDPTDGGYDPPLKWYKCQMSPLNAKDEKEIPKEKWSVGQKTLLVTCKRDPIGVPVLQVEGMKPWVRDMVAREVDAGHWGHQERAREFNEILEEFLG